MSLPTNDPFRNQYAGDGAALTWPFTFAKALSADASNDLTVYPRGFMVSADATVVVDPMDSASDASISLVVKAGVVYPIRIRRFRSITTGTLTALW